MSNPSDIPALEPLEESAAPAPAAATAPQAVTPVSLGGLPAPFFGARAQKEYYRFFFAGLIMFLGCMMPFGPEWAMAGYQTMGGALSTLIALGIMWTSWVAISHGRFDLSSMRWVVFATIPLTIQTYHLVTAMDEPAVQAYRVAFGQGPGGEHVINSWAKFFENLSHFKSPVGGAHVDNFLRYYGTGKVVLWFGSLYAVLLLLMGIVSGMRSGRSKKKAQAAARASKGKRR